MAALSSALLRAPAGNGKIDYSEFVGVLFNSVRLPPPVVISDELKPYWDALQSRVDPHAKKP